MTLVWWLSGGALGYILADMAAHGLPGRNLLHKVYGLYLARFKPEVYVHWVLNLAMRENGHRKPNIYDRKVVDEKLAEPWVKTLPPSQFDKEDGDDSEW